MPTFPHPTYWAKRCTIVMLAALASVLTFDVATVSAGPDDIGTFAGTGTSGTSGDGGPATAAQLSGPLAVAADTADNVFIADMSNNRVRKVDPSNTITTVAGDGVLGFGGDGGLATAAQLAEPLGVAVDGTGNIFIGDTGNHRVRRVDAGTGIITTVAGNGTSGSSGDGGLATAAQLNRPRGVVVDAAGNLFIADAFNNRVRRVDAVTGIITMVAGVAPGGFSGDGGPAASAQLNNPTFLAFDSSENLFIADTFNGRVRRVDAVSGLITTIVGNGDTLYVGDGIPATAAGGLVPLGVAIDGAGNLVFASSAGNRVFLVHGGSGLITTIAGIGTCGYTGDAGPATAAQLCSPGSVAVDATGEVFIADNGNSVVRTIAAVGSCGDGVSNGGESCDEAVANGTNLSCCGAICTTVADSDGDGPCDAIDPCTNVAGARNFAVKPPAKLIVGKINTDTTPLNDKLSLAGEFVQDGAPLFATLDPSSRGVHLLVQNSGGVTRIDVRLPGGSYAGKGTRGWGLAGSGKKWGYKDATGNPIAGIAKMAIADKAKTAPGRVAIKAQGSKGTYPVVSGDEPLRAIVVLGGPNDGAAGRCGETAFAPGDCAFNSSQATLICK
ncbi:MAG: hypothetical protein IT293_20495 [Deltaproteobacteria bacterium]|nr:hypothetical protein [Deltaproteobacteria bacterium]